MTARKHILIVDDDERVRFVLSRTLMGVSNGYDIATARNGREALVKAGMMPLDLVITDLRMPDVDGVELTEAIKSSNAEATVIWITAYGCHEFADEATRLSVYDCLEKPLKVGRIRHIVQEALENTGETEPNDCVKGGT